MLRLWLTVCLCFAFLHAVADDADDIQYVVVADPFIDLRTGPGDGYPITHVFERNDQVGIIKRRTDWFKITGGRGKEGWAHLDQLTETLQLTGDPVEIPAAGIDEFVARRWEGGVMGGSFDGADSLTLYGGYRLSKHLALEAEGAKVFGDVSDGWYATINIVHTFVPEWRVSPFVSLGAGIIRVDPKSSLAQSDDEDRDEDLAVVGIGIRTYLSNRFILRAEYKGYRVLTDRNNNEDVEEWRAGFAVFF